METGQPYRCLLISHPRTASNLLVRILALDNQPNFAHYGTNELPGYFFQAAARLETDLGLRGIPVGEWSEEHRSKVKQKMKDCIDNLEKYMKSAEMDGKNVFVKEHSYCLIEPTART